MQKKEKKKKKKGKSKSTSSSSSSYPLMQAVMSTLACLQIGHRWLGSPIMRLWGYHSYYVHLLHIDVCTHICTYIHISTNTFSYAYTYLHMLLHIYIHITSTHTWISMYIHKLRRKNKISYPLKEIWDNIKQEYAKIHT